MTYQLQLLHHRDTGNLSIGQCWHTLHNSHLHHKYNQHYWLHHCNGHFQPSLHNHNLKIGEKYIYLCCITIDNFWTFLSAAYESLNGGNYLINR